MNRKENIQSEIDKTLSQFNNNDSLKQNPFLYTRIKHEIDNRQSNKFNLGSILKPVFFTLLLSMNMFTAIWYLNYNDNIILTSSKQGLAEIFTEDFNIDNYESDLLIVE